MHNGFITINKEKMSKSLGNIFYLTKALQMYNPKVLRLFLLSCHYRHPLEFNPESINSMNSAYTRIENTLSKIDFYLKRRDTLDLTYDYEKFLSKLNELETNFHKFMDDDLNTEKALSEIFKFISFFNDYISQGEIHPLVLRLVKEYIIKLMNILGIELGEPKVLLGVNKLPERLVELILEIREDLRKNKDFNQADKIRSKLKELGITVEDTKYGPRYLFSNHYNLILK
jgi:cysteinyl-tRNA synthetase